MINEEYLLEAIDELLQEMTKTDNTVECLFLQKQINELFRVYGQFVYNLKNNKK